jgi:hypothetical protein
MKGKVLLQGLVAVVCLLILSVPSGMAQGQTGDCYGNFDCDQDVDGGDVEKFLSSFGRSQYFNPCPLCQDSPCPCTICPYGMVDCGDKCVDPMTDEDFCGVDSACLGGAVCGVTEKCVIGACEDVGGNVYQASVPKTGQTTSYATGDDGDLQKGLIWPYPRFTDNADGTVTDNLTNLIWLKDANCFGERTWNNALSDSNGLASGSCGLTDGSGAGDWRLPNRRELFSLMHDDYYNPAVPDTAGTGQWSQGDPFNNVQSSYYWSSTTLATSSGYAWYVRMDIGRVDGSNKASINYVWPVRGGQ